MRHSRALLGLSLLALPLPAVADPTFDLYGQLDFGIFRADDGVESETYITDNDNSNSRVGFNWTNDLGGGRALRFTFETALGLRGSSAVTIDDTDLDPDYSRTELRKVEFVYTTPDIGTFSFGQGSMAMDGVTEADLSGTGVIAYSGLADLAGSIVFRDGAGGTTGTDIGDVFGSFDGARRFRLRYDTDPWRGLVLSVSGGEEVLRKGDENEYYDVAAKYTADYGDLEVDTRIGYAWVSGGEEVAVGSVAVLHAATGLSLAVAGGAQQEGSADYLYAKLGWQQQWLAAGITAFSVDLFDGADYAFDRSDSRSVGLAVVQKIDALNLEIFATWRRHEFDAPGASFRDVDVIALGARWKF